MLDFNYFLKSNLGLIQLDDLILSAKIMHVALNNYLLLTRENQILNFLMSLF